MKLSKALVVQVGADGSMRLCDIKKNDLEMKMENGWNGFEFYCRTEARHFDETGGNRCESTKWLRIARYALMTSLSRP